MRQYPASEQATEFTGFAQSQAGATAQEAVE